MAASAPRASGSPPNPAENAFVQNSHSSSGRPQPQLRSSRMPRCQMWRSSPTDTKPSTWPRRLSRIVVPLRPEPAMYRTIVTRAPPVLASATLFGCSFGPHRRAHGPLLVGVRRLRRAVALLAGPVRSGFCEPDQPLRLGVTTLGSQDGSVDDRADGREVRGERTDGVG